jgi:hypothetical protein
MRVRRHNFNIVGNTAIPTIQVRRKRRYAIIWVRWIASSTITTAATAIPVLATNTIIITVKTMRITSNNFEVTGGHITTIQVWGRTRYACIRIGRMATLNRW